MSKSVLLAFFLLSLLFSASALAADLQSDLAASYQKQVLILRNPVRSNSLKYDAAGNLIGKADPGAWTAFGAIEITSIRFTADALLLEGTRRIFGYDTRQHILLPFKIKEKEKTRVKLELALAAPLSSVADADTAINRIFTRNDDELIASVPDYWRPFLQILYGRVKGNDAPAATEKPIDLGLARPIPGYKPGKPMMINGKLITPPHPKSTPPPGYEDAAIKVKAQGTVLLEVVVDREGHVNSPRIITPVGAGLDEKAVETVRQWKFDPATEDGKPVSIEMAVEVVFYPPYPW